MDAKKKFLKSVIEKEVFIRSSERKIISPNHTEQEWIFDFRKSILKPSVLNAYADLFFELYAPSYPFQVCGLEVAAIPLVSAIVMKSVEKGIPVNGFFIRKSRKKTGLLNMIEGEVDGTPIILVDDMINSGGSFVRQIEVLEEAKRKGDISCSVKEVFSILRFRDLENYSYFSDKGIKINSLFALDDFQQELSVSNLISKQNTPKINVFDILWAWKGAAPNLWQVRPKSAPVLYNDKVFFGTDSGYFVCLDAETGKEVWSYLVSIGKKNIEIFSSPCIGKNVVVFGSYDGNVYALDIQTGKRRWVYMDADWVKGSSVYSSTLGYVFVPLTFGLLKKHGKVVAIEEQTGKKSWEFSTDGFIEGGIAYSDIHKMIFFGTETMIIYGVDAKTGDCIWEKKVHIKIQGTPRIDEASRTIIFGGVSEAKEEGNRSYIYVCDMKTGKDISIFKELSFGIYGTPIVYHQHVFAASLDKMVYCFDLVSGRLIWKTNMDARCFASPVLISTDGNVRLYIGANNGRLHEINIETGEIISIAYFTERIVDAVVFDEVRNTLLVPTFANELYAVRRKNLE